MIWAAWILTWDRASWNICKKKWRYYAVILWRRQMLLRPVQKCLLFIVSMDYGKKNGPKMVLLLSFMKFRYLKSSNGRTITAKEFVKLLRELSKMAPWRTRQPSPNSFNHFREAGHRKARCLGATRVKIGEFVLVYFHWQNSTAT